MKNKGYILTAAISSLRHIKCDDVWQITRINSEITGTKWVPELAPSPDLFRMYNNVWKNLPEKDWWSTYEKIFNNELEHTEKKTMLRKLWHEVESGKIIALVCFCSDPQYCHRRLVGNFIANHGITVTEFKMEIDINKPQQLELF